MNTWFTEYQYKDLIFGCRIKEILHHKKSQYQEILVLDTYHFGKMLTLDNVVQASMADEFVYHEMITHVGLNTLPNPKKVLVIGGGDGGSVREVLKHKEIQKVTHVEIDRDVITAAQTYLPEICYNKDDPRVELIIGDGIKHVKESQSVYDMIIIDAPDPVGHAEGLFSAEFYQNVYNALTDDGLFVAQMESPFFDKDLINRVMKDIRAVYPIERLFLGNVPTYPGGLWAFAMGSKRHDPIKVDPDCIKEEIVTRYYNKKIHGASFILPTFVQELLL